MPPGGRAASPGRSYAGPGSDLFVKKREKKKNDFSKEAQVPKHYSLFALSQGAVLQKPFSIPWDFASDLPCQCRKYYRLQGPVSSSAFTQHSRLNHCQGRKRCWSNVFSGLGRQLVHVQGLRRTRPLAVCHLLVWSLSLLICKVGPP